MLNYNEQNYNVGWIAGIRRMFVLGHLDSCYISHIWKSFLYYQCEDNSFSVNNMLTSFSYLRTKQCFHSDWQSYSNRLLYNIEYNIHSCVILRWGAHFYDCVCLSFKECVIITDKYVMVSFARSSRVMHDAGGVARGTLHSCTCHAAEWCTLHYSMFTSNVLGKSFSGWRWRADRQSDLRRFLGLQSDFGICKSVLYQLMV